MQDLNYTKKHAREVICSMPPCRLEVSPCASCQPNMESCSNAQMPQLRLPEVIKRQPRCSTRHPQSPLLTHSNERTSPPKPTPRGSSLTWAHISTSQSVSFPESHCTIPESHCPCRPASAQSMIITRHPCVMTYPNTSFGHHVPCECAHRHHRHR